MERFLFYLFSHLSFHVVHVSTNSEKSTGIPRFYQIQVPLFKKSPQKPTWKFPRLWQHCDLAADRGKPLELEKNRSLFTIQTRPREFFAFATVFLYVNVVSFEGR